VAYNKDDFAQARLHGQSKFLFNRD